MAAVPVIFQTGRLSLDGWRGVNAKLVCQTHDGSGGIAVIVAGSPPKTAVDVEVDNRVTDLAAQTAERVRVVLDIFKAEFGRRADQVEAPLETPVESMTLWTLGKPTRRTPGHIRRTPDELHLCAANALAKRFFVPHTSSQCI